MHLCHQRSEELRGQVDMGLQPPTPTHNTFADVRSIIGTSGAQLFLLLQRLLVPQLHGSCPAHGSEGDVSEITGGGGSPCDHIHSRQLSPALVNTATNPATPFGTRRHYQRSVHNSLTPEMNLALPGPGQRQRVAHGLVVYCFARCSTFWAALKSYFSFRVVFVLAILPATTHHPAAVDVLRRRCGSTSARSAVPRRWEKELHVGNASKSSLRIFHTTTPAPSTCPRRPRDDISISIDSAVLTGV